MLLQTEKENLIITPESKEEYLDITQIFAILVRDGNGRLDIRWEKVGNSDRNSLIVVIRKQSFWKRLLPSWLKPT